MSRKSTYLEWLEKYGPEIKRSSARYSKKVQGYDKEDFEQEICLRLWKRKQEQTVKPEVFIRMNIRQGCLSLYRYKPKRCGQINPTAHIPDHSPMIVETTRPLSDTFPPAHIDWREYEDHHLHERVELTDLLDKLWGKLTPTGRAIVKCRIAPSKGLLKLVNNDTVEPYPTRRERKTITITQKAVCEHLSISKRVYVQEMKLIAEAISELTS